ncbi:uncharacterized protein LOC109863002 isoform X1 [Pseudomyrmex gracilis]|uniref:uncharacterized protein LOC109863002 isoform X1 n=1 Tax=Pseudomyrmex gracilis TaxID=219809 RepID=UPI00099525BE|nr:uncharacterized protein LOC109863002 isoform X1 [Pseudomyrmex gracilis]
MISNERAVLIIFAITLFVTSGSALRCWVCSSNVNVVCDDPMNTTEHHTTFHARDCNEYSRDHLSGHYGNSRAVCRKIVKRDYGQRIVVRQCSTLNHDEIDIVDGTCGASAQQGPVEIESCHICSTDLCNSATSVSTMQLLYAAVLVFVTYVFHQSKYCGL